MPKQINVLLEDDMIESLEKLTLKRTNEMQKKTTISDTVRQMINYYNEQNPESYNTNRIYKIVSNDQGCHIDVDFFIGDKQIEKSKARSGEILFITDENNLVKKLEGMFLIPTVPLSSMGLSLSSDYHPSLFYIKLNKDFLKKDFWSSQANLNLTMGCTNACSINDVSWGGRYFDKYKKEGIIHKEGNIYETIDFPQIDKLRCVEYKHF